MCHLLTFATAKSKNAPPSSRELNVEQFNGTTTGHKYADSLDVYSLTRGGCSCELVSIGAEQNDNSGRELALRKKYERKGWSEAKISRALESVTGTV
jgi:hypothetical protein